MDAQIIIMMCLFIFQLSHLLFLRFGGSGTAKLSSPLSLPSPLPLSPPSLSLLRSSRSLLLPSPLRLSLWRLLLWRSRSPWRSRSLSPWRSRSPWRSSLLWRSLLSLWRRPLSSPCLSRELSLGDGGAGGGNVCCEVVWLGGTELRVPALVKPDIVKVATWDRSAPLGASVGTELKLPALVQPDVLLELLLSFGGPLDAATKWLLYWA